MAVKLTDISANKPYTALLYCMPGIGKSTAIGLIAEKSEGNTLVLDVDKTIVRTLQKQEVVKDLSKILVEDVPVNDTFKEWADLLKNKITPEYIKENNIVNIAVDNITELERCVLADLGSKGKNKGVPAQADYQYMQFQLVKSLRLMKDWGVNIIWTAWEEPTDYIHPDGTSYTMLKPRINRTIRDEVCGLCDVVGRITVKSDSGERGILLEATQNIYAKNQIDNRKGCKVAEFTDFKINN
jgi:phage nucleotide-binding protein